MDFNSVERIGEYLEVVQEAPPIVESKRPPAWWPSSSGALEVQDLVVKYAPDLPPALNGLSFTVKPSEKIGVVRTLPPDVNPVLTFMHRSVGLGLVRQLLSCMRLEFL